MSLVVAKQADLELPELRDWVQAGSDKREVVYGFSKVFSGKEWTLVERDALANVFTAKLKPNFNFQEIFKEESPYRIIRQEPERFIVVVKQVQEPCISSREEFEKVLEQSAEERHAAMSYLLRSFSTLESYNNSNIRNFFEGQLSGKEEVVNKVTKQYYNKQFVGEQAFMVPKYHPQTGNWDDKQTTKLNLKQI